MTVIPLLDFELSNRHNSIYLLATKNMMVEGGFLGKTGKEGWMTVHPSEWPVPIGEQKIRGFLVSCQINVRFRLIQGKLQDVSLHLHRNRAFHQPGINTGWLLVKQLHSFEKECTVVFSQIHIPLATRYLYHCDRCKHMTPKYDNPFAQS